MLTATCEGRGIANGEVATSVKPVWPVLLGVGYRLCMYRYCLLRGGRRRRRRCFVPLTFDIMLCGDGAAT